MGVDDVVGVAGLQGAVLELRVDVVGQGVARHAVLDVHGVQLAARAAHAALLDRLVDLGVEHQLGGGGGGVAAAGAQIAVRDGAGVAVPQRRANVGADAAPQAVREAQGAAVRADVDHRLGGEDLDAAVALLEAQVGLPQLVAEAARKLEAVVQIHAQLLAMPRQVVGGEDR